MKKLLINSFLILIIGCTSAPEKQNIAPKKEIIPEKNPPIVVNIQEKK